jgi:hypothetical protein
LWSTLTIGSVSTKPMRSSRRYTAESQKDYYDKLKETKLKELEHNTILTPKEGRKERVLVAYICRA